MSPFESDLAQKFAPTYHSSGNEPNHLAQLEPQPEPRLALAHPPERPYVYFSSYSLDWEAAGEQAYEINYLTIWDRDSGFRPTGWGHHQWDTERTAVLVVGPANSADKDQFESRQVYYAAHEGHPLSQSDVWVCRNPGTKGHHVWWSKGKHASYRNVNALQHTLLGPLEAFDVPEVVAPAKEYPLVDAGTWDHHSKDAPWIAWDQGWGPHGVCSYCTKLQRRIWDGQGRQQIPTRTLTTHDFMLLQAQLGIEETGQFDDATVAALAEKQLLDLVWQQGGLSQDQIHDVETDFGIDLSPFMVDTPWPEG
jgi:hypothetical protein